MKRSFLACLVSAVALAPAAAQPPEEKKATIAYVQKLQTSNGGFFAFQPGPNVRAAPTLRATSAAVRALHYLGGEVKDTEGARKFVESCFHPDGGGFSDFPRGKPDVFATSVGLMAVVALKMPAEKYEGGAVKYLAAHAKDFEEIRIAVAGLEAVGKKSPAHQAWLDKVGEYRIHDEPDGPKGGATRAAGSLLVASLRLGMPLADREAALKVLRQGQRRDGGFGKEGVEGSDLESTYRVMRALHMLKARPSDVDGLRRFVASCRNEDGGYGPNPGEASNVGATYYAAIIYHWLGRE